MDDSSRIDVTGPQPYNPEAVRKITMIGNYLPRQCGIATFTFDLATALARAARDTSVAVVAMNDVPQGYPYPPEVEFEINQNVVNDYRLAASFLNMNRFDVACLQHEYNIFGGTDGSYVVRLIEQLHMPVVTVLHTVLKKPSLSQKRVLTELAEHSDRMVVMSENSRHLLADVYGVEPARVRLIPHGIPDTPFVDPSFFKDRFSVDDRWVILTFGLISPAKGIENVIRALPRIVERHPDVAYIVLGATHPHVKRSRGEAYRLSLHQLARDLKVDGHVIFHNRFVDLAELCEFLGAADIYVTPYLEAEQAVSGTLAYAMGTGKAVVSTPYWYAREMLDEGRGKLVPFRDPDALAEAVIQLLDNRHECNAMRKRAYTYGRSSIWKEVAWRYLEVFRGVCQERERQPRRMIELVTVRGQTAALPEIDLSHLQRLTDDTGIFQHAIVSVPDRRYGYCTDDNARGLVVTLLARGYVSPEKESLELGRIYLGFLAHALDPETGSFRHYLGFDRVWQEKEGSPDSHGRAIWALGIAAAEGDDHTREVAAHLMHAILARAEKLSDLRAVSLSILGLNAYLARLGGDSAVKRLRSHLAELLLDAFHRRSTADWPWPEETLTYANARLPHALIAAGRSMERSEMIETGLGALQWLVGLQTSERHFVPVGNRGWFPRGGTRARFDQQPVEAEAMVAACAEAYRATRKTEWLERANICFHWFLGRNDLGIAVYDYATGGCRDGLGPSSANDNQGAQSTLAWLYALVQMHELQAEGALQLAELAMPANDPAVHD